MFLLSENTVNKMLRQGSAGDLVKHNLTHLVRIYPKGMRLNSTSYEPRRFWAVGTQLVALNWQTCGACSSLPLSFFPSLCRRRAEMGM